MAVILLFPSIADSTKGDIVSLVLDELATTGTAASSKDVVFVEGSIVEFAEGETVEDSSDDIMEESLVLDELATTGTTASSKDVVFVEGFIIVEFAEGETVEVSSDDTMEESSDGENVLVESEGAIVVIDELSVASIVASTVGEKVVAESLGIMVSGAEADRS
jgi:hypothetical protein